MGGGEDVSMAGILARLLGYALVFTGVILDWENMADPNLTGGLVVVGLAILLPLAFHRMWKTRGKMRERDDE